MVAKQQGASLVKRKMGMQDCLGGHGGQVPSQVAGNAARCMQRADDLHRADCVAQRLQAACFPPWAVIAGYLWRHRITWNNNTGGCMVTAHVAHPFILEQK